MSSQKRARLRQKDSATMHPLAKLVFDEIKKIDFIGFDTLDEAEQTLGVKRSFIHRFFSADRKEQVMMDNIYKTLTFFKLIRGTEKIEGFETKDDLNDILSLKDKLIKALEELNDANKRIEIFKDILEQNKKSKRKEDPEEFNPTPWRKSCDIDQYNPSNKKALQ